MASERKMLDLFCCEGIGAWGYWLSGRFSEITGVDIDDEMRTRYSFNLRTQDALKLTYEEFPGYSFIHASPPCQAYSKRTPDQTRHMRLIAATHLMCQASGLPYVIENVEGSGIELRPNLVMDGLSVGLTSKRRRYFYVSTLKESIRMISNVPASHVQGTMTRAEAIEAFGLDVINPNRLRRITLYGMEQCIPPAMTRFIAELVFPDKVMVG